MSSRLEAVGVTVRLGGRAVLRDVDVALSGGELVALIGPNGAGKSTLLAALAGDARPAEGRVALDGRDLRDWSAAALARQRAVLTQRPTVGFAYSVRQVVELGRHGRRRTRAHDGGGSASHPEVRPAVDPIEDLLEAVGLAGYGPRPIDTLSGGEAARVHLARVLAQEAPIVLLDEPTAALDLRHQHLVMALAVRHARLGGSAVVVLHDLNLAAAYADRVVLLSEGGVAADGPPPRALTPALLHAAYGHPVRLVAHPSQCWRAIVADRLSTGDRHGDGRHTSTRAGGRGTEDRGRAHLS